MTLRDSQVLEILDMVVQNTPRLKPGDGYYLMGYKSYIFSSHDFIAKYRQWREDAYSRLLDDYRYSTMGIDRKAHAQIAACLGRYAKGHTELSKIGRIKLSKDVHGNEGRPMWWVLRRR